MKQILLGLWRLLIAITILPIIAIIFFLPVLLELLGTNYDEWGSKKMIFNDMARYIILKLLII